MRRRTDPECHSVIVAAERHSEEGALLAAARAYARRGWAVLPLYEPDREGGCSCRRSGCTSAGKHPRTPNGVHDATTDDDTIRRWWTRWPAANIGVATGERSGVVVLDVDPRHGGAVALEEREATYGRLPSTPSVSTGGGGYHHVFSLTEDVAASRELAPGLELKANGAYVVAPPSLHSSGRTYRWERDEGPHEVPLAQPPTWLSAPALVAALGSSDRDHFREGERNDHLFRIACLLRRLGLDQQVIEEHVQHTNAGLCRPPLPGTEVHQIAASAARYALEQELEAAHVLTSHPDKFKLHTINDLMALPPPQWLIRGVMEEGTLAVLYGPSGGGKTFVALDWALSLATGSQWHGLFVKQGPVVYIAAEGGAGIKKRVRAWLNREGLTDDPPAFFILEAPQLRDVEDVVLLLRRIRERTRQPSLIVIDTFAASAVGADENTARDVGEWIAAARRIQRETGATVMAVHHTGKKGSDERGSSALRAGVETMIRAAKSGTVITITNDKQKDHGEFQEI